MSDSFGSARRALTRTFQTRTLRRANGDTSPAGLSPAGGRLGAAEGRRQGRGDYRISLPGDTAMELALDERVTFDEVPGRVFRIVWAPPPGNLRLTRPYGADEVI